MGVALVAGIGMTKAQAYQVKPAKLWVTATAIGTPIEGAKLRLAIIHVQQARMAPVYSN